jgi:hypothetical protein
MRFNMMDYNSIVTPMETNLNTLSDSSSDSYLVDPTLSRKLIGSFMYLVNTKIDIFFIVSTLRYFIVEPIHYLWAITKYGLRYLHGTI